LTVLFEVTNLGRTSYFIHS